MTADGVEHATVPAPRAEDPAGKLSRAERQQRRIAARQHGLFARAAPNLRSRTIRVGYLVERAYRDLQDLDRRDEATVRAWARAECRAVDCYARLESDPENGKLADQWRAAENLAAARRADLFLSPASRLAAAKLMAGVRADQDAAAATAELQARYGPRVVPESPAAAGDQDGRSGASELDA